MFFDGQKITLKVPVIRLADLSIKEIAERNLLPIGQFYLRTFETLTKGKIKKFSKTAEELLKELKKAVDNGSIPRNTAEQMQETIRKTIDNAIARSDEEVEVVMTTNITETLPWIDYNEVAEQLKELGRAEGMAEGRAEGKAEGKAEGMAEGKAVREKELAIAAFSKFSGSTSAKDITDMLMKLGIPENTIREAAKLHTQK